MAVYYKNNKILDLRVIGLDPTKVYTKEEIDAKILEYEKLIGTEILSTTNKTVTGAINELNKKISDINSISNNDIDKAFKW